MSSRRGLVLMLACLLAGLFPASAASAATGSISGSVSTSTGETIRACVEVWTADERQVDINIATDPDGSYSFGGLSTGRYKVKFFDCQDSRFVEQWYPDAEAFETASAVEVTDGSDTGGVDATLVLGGTIHGLVTNSSGEPLRSVSVHTYGPLGSPFAYSRGFSTAADGTYAVPGLRSGSYAVGFSCPDGSCLTEWYEGKRWRDEADPIVVLEGHDVAGIDAELDGAGFLSGRATNISGEPVEGECVFAAGQGDSWIAFTHEDGSYFIEGLPPGEYVVGFGGCFDASTYPRQWFPGVWDRAEAQVVDVLPLRETTGVDITLRLPDGITGTVRDTAGRRLHGACVTVTADGFEAQTFTDYRGQYVFKDLPAGSYALRFDGCEAGPYLPEWFDNARSAAAAQRIDITQGAHAAGIDAVLELGGSISGTVTSDHGGTVADVCVELFDETRAFVATGRTDASGAYEVLGLLPGSYRLRFESCSDPETTVAEWYRDGGSFEEANVVVVAEGARIGGLDARIQTCVRGADADGDDLNDCDEMRYGTDRFEPDTDGDTFTDGFEVYGGTCIILTYEGGSDPRDAGSTPLGTVPAPGSLPRSVSVC